jgi:hypothetical protein
MMIPVEADSKISHTKRFKLSVHQFPEGTELTHVELVGRRYIKRTFQRRKAPFCHTTDGIPVFYRIPYFKLICSGKDAPRTVDLLRVQRVHWIKPIIEGKPHGVLMCDDGDKRRYFINSLKYLVILAKRKNEFELITAYRITEQWEKERVRRQMGLD